MQVDSLARGDLKLRLHCGDDCVRVADITVGARELEGQGWQSVTVPLSCFARSDDTFTHVNIPFQAVGGGAGQVRFANTGFESAAAHENTSGSFARAQTPLTSV